MLTCIIIEDQPPAQRILQQYISDIGIIELKGVFPDALQSIKFLKSQTVDLIFLDIHLPSISGISFLKSIPNLPNVILTTAFSEYALESYDYSVVDYLLKPFSFERFVKAVSKIEFSNDKKQVTKSLMVSELNNKKIFIKSGHDLIQIQINTIKFIKSDMDYTEINTNEKKYLSTKSLKDWLSELDNNLFCKVHKSYIVNVEYLFKISGGNIFLKDSDITIPIGRVYKDNLFRRHIK